VLNTVDGCIPADLGVGTKEDIEEERRLLYVAMTRAKDNLNLVMPQRFFPHGQAARGDRHLYASRTRFIPASILAAFQQISWPSAQAAQGRAPRPEVRVDIGARMRGMWK
jgi:DNA helicase-2/ATP-dependent DNA helicase PcrA